MQISILKMLIRKVLNKYNTEYLLIISDLKNKTEIRDDKNNLIDIEVKQFSDLLLNKIEKNFKNAKLFDVQIFEDKIEGFVLFESEGTNFKKKIIHKF